MKTMDSIGLKLCSYQAEIFRASRDTMECSSKIFIRRFMNSDFAARMDDPGFLFSSMLADSASELENQYGISKYGSEKFPAEELYWIGYIYRYWVYISGRSSKQLYKLLKPEQLRNVYYPYHSLDPQQAIERICEGYEIEPENTFNIAEEVAILRKIREKYRQQ